MFRKIILPLGGLTVAGGIYLQKQKVDLKNQTLRSFLAFLHNQNPKYSSFLFKNIIRFCFIKQCPSIGNYVFSEGFDLDALYLPGLLEIGFDTVYVGPMSLIPSCAEQNRMHFGNKTALANISSLYEQRALANENPLKTRVGVSITPNYEIIKYAPYLIQQNMLQCLKQFQQLNEISQSLLIHRYILRLDQSDLKEMQTPQYLTLVKELIVNSQKTIQQSLNSKKNLFPAMQNQQIPQLLVQIPNQNQNKKLFDLVKALPEVKNLIIDGAEYQVVRSTQTINKKNIQTVQLMVGKKRINFQQLLQRVVDDSL